MKVIENNFIPSKNFLAINIFGLLFVRCCNKDKISEETKRHERIHTEQMKELCFIVFYVWYGIEWLIKIIWHKNLIKAYYSIAFEKEAYRNEKDERYFSKRKRFNWIKLI